MSKKLKGFEESLLEVRKVTKVTTGGRRMRFRATVLVGDRAGHIGIGTSKGVDVVSAVQKATQYAYKNIYEVAITKDGSVPYMVTRKYKASYVVLRPAGPGTGLKAGSSVRTVLELAGFSNILSKIIGSNNLLNNAIATITAITNFKVDSEKIQAIQAVEELDEEEEANKKSRKPRRYTKKDATKTNTTRQNNKTDDKKGETKSPEKSATPETDTKKTVQETEAPETSSTVSNDDTTTEKNAD